MTQPDNNNTAPNTLEEAEEALNTSPSQPLVSEELVTAETPTEATSITIVDAAESQAADAANAPIELADAKRVLEAALLAANEAMQINELRRLFDGQINGDTLRILLDELKLEWQDRSVELNLVAGGYRFRVKPQYQRYLDKLSNDKPPKYSRAVMETLAIIAYRQPVTRADIEDVRGVQVSPHILKVLEDRGWVEEIGHKEVVGRPALFATTKHFLDDLNLRTLEELPPLHELQSTLENPHNAASLMGALELTPMAAMHHYVDEVPSDAALMAENTEPETSELPSLQSEPLPNETVQTSPDGPMESAPPADSTAAPAIEEDKKSW
jgi:segregation and condensation protein B